MFAANTLAYYSNSIGYIKKVYDIELTITKRRKEAIRQAYFSTFV